MYIDESGDEHDKDNEFRWEVEKQMMTHWRHHVDMFAMEDPRAVQRRIQREVGRELRDKCQAQVQDVFEKHMSKLFLEVVAEEWGIKLGHEEMEYLKRVGFLERVDGIHAEVSERHAGDGFMWAGNRWREGSWNKRQEVETKRRVAEEMRHLLETFRGRTGSGKYFGTGSRAWGSPAAWWQ
ncbi:hypothetical protein DENSPDRAFT_286488 [Dentipellis sp. KUC8613]|nr:hypothetical protein DENSPDRAFT_286488 [Dentipellis sp. KUC8613]